MTDPRVSRIERGLDAYGPGRPDATAALADLRAWQEIAERHASVDYYDDHDDDDPVECASCSYDDRRVNFPCPDRKAADAALDRLYALWGANGWSEQP